MLTRPLHGTQDIMRELINLLVLPLLALILLALYFYPDRLEDLISWVQDFFRN